MLSRKVSGSSLMSQTVGIDRGRVGERLQAALAGLQELHLLKEKQRHMVHWAMRMDREESESSTLTRSDSERLYSEEQRLEATLTSLKQQLSRLRRQDVGLKTHLQHLDEQISELKLDVSKASTEQLENDSRPSSGFYELSDGGSCSLSNSCTSVYSECLSSSSQSNLVPAACFGGPNPHHGPSHAEASRRRSADESTTHVNVLRATGLHLGSSRIRGGAAGPERARQRPVSTGDLDRMLTQGPVYNKCGDARTPALCSSPRTSTVDPKFQSSLVSRSGIEVYHYPSPLHAVALQSPIFSLSMEPATPAAPGTQGPPEHCIPSLDTLPRGDDRTEIRPLGYIHKVLQRSMSKLNIQVEAGREAVRPNVGYRRETAGNQVVAPVRAPVQRCLPAHTVDAVPANRMRQCVVHSSQEQVDRCHPGQILSTPALEPSNRYSYPAALRDCSPREAIPGRSRAQAETSGEKTRPDARLVEVSESRLLERRGCERRSELAHGSSTEESLGFEGHPVPRVLPDFVHAKFVPAGSQQVKVRPADRKTKAVKLRKKSSEKPRVVKHQLSYSSSERSRDASAAARGDPELRGPGKGKSSPRLASRLGEERRRSGSESSLCGPAHLCNHRVHPQPRPVPATKPGKVTRPQGLDLELRAEQRKKSQGAPRWPSDLKMLQAMHAQGQRSREPHAQGRSVAVRSASARPHSGQWSGPLRSLQPSLSSSSYFDHLNARYPPAPLPRSGHHPPRCESEYSAECASLFHSTIAESSEEELSDNTTNRFGDSESSQSSPSPSDSDGSLSTDEGEHVDGVEDERGLVWAKATVGPTAAGLTLQQLPRPERPACRIKASRALKKKIRRFQSASLKVMTLV